MANLDLTWFSAKLGHDKLFVKQHKASMRSWTLTHGMWNSHKPVEQSNVNTLETLRSGSLSLAHSQSLHGCCLPEKAYCQTICKVVRSCWLDYTYLQYKLS